MQVFKTFFRIQKKNIRGMLIYVCIFIGLAIGLSWSGKENDPGTFSLTAVDFVVDNQDNGELGQTLTKQLAGKNNILDYPESEEKLLDAMYNREIDYVLMIPEDFTEKFINGDRSGLLKTKKVPSSQDGTLLDTQIEQYVGVLGMYLDSGFSVEEAIAYTSVDMDGSAEVTFLSGENEGGKEKAYYYFQYLAYIFTAIMIAGLGATLMVFRKKEIMDRNQCSSTSVTSQNLQIILGSGLTALIFYGVFMIMACLIYWDFVTSVSGVLSMMNAFVYILFALALTFFVSQFVRTDNGISAASNIFGLGLSFIGGVFVPMEIFSKPVLQAAKFTPSYWYVIANDALQGAESVFGAAPEVYLGFFIQLGFAAAFICAGLLVGRLKR